jgi:hypothetical protein
MAALFDTYVVVDWSAAATPKQGADSIWLCHLSRFTGRSRLANPATRHEAETQLTRLIEADLAAGRRILAGFDFPFAYSAGLAARLALGSPAWRAVWDEIAALIRDDARNGNNRFAVAAELNRRISGGAFPFWACPIGQASPTLGMRHHRRHETEGLAERRLAEHRVVGPQPAWKLAGTGSAGGQALTGIPVVRRLRDKFGSTARVWPFETGLAAPARRSQVVFAEVYPSLVVPSCRPGEPKDAGQVRAMAGHFAALDERGALAALFAGDPDLLPAERAVVEREEGWILGVVKETRRPSRTRTAELPPLRSGGGSGWGHTPRGSARRKSPQACAPTPALPRKRGRGSAPAQTS